MRIGRLLLIAVLLGAQPGSSFADNAGTSSAQFLTLGAGARAAGMGEAFSAAVNDATAVRYNPAAMTRVPGMSFSAMHAEHLKSTKLEHLAFVKRNAGENALGLSILRMDYGSIDKTDAAGAAIGTAKPGDLALTAAFAFQPESSGFLQDSSVGLSVGYIQSKIVESANAVTASFGFLTGPLGSARLRGSLVGENLIGSLKYDQKKDPLPMRVRLGAAAPLGRSALATVELVSPNDGDIYGAVGGEKWLGTPGEGTAFALRAGYNTRTKADLSGLAGFAMGMGALFRGGMGVDYAFVPFGDLGGTHRLSLSYGFGGVEPVMAAAPPPPEPAPAPPVMSAQIKGPPSLPPGKTYDQHTREAVTAMKAGNNAAAVRSLAAADSLLSSDDERRIFVLERRGALAIREKDVEAAKKLYIESISLAKTKGVSNDHLVNSYLGLAWCLTVQGQLPAAEKNYLKARELSDNPETKKKIDQKLLELQTLSTK